MVVVRDRALLLRRFPFSESSLVVHVATRAHGRLHLLAKGAYRPTSRYFAVLDYFDTLEVEWDHHPQRELSNLRAGALFRRRPRLPHDLACYRSALAMLELADVAFRPAHPDAALFDLLERSLDRLHERAFHGRAAAELAQVEFELAYLETLGLGIRLDACAACGGPAPAIGRDGLRAAFSAGAGGRLCAACAASQRANGRRVGTMPVRVLEDARALARSAGTAALEESAERVAAVRDLVERFLDYHLETRPRTQRAFLAHPNRNAHPAAGR